MKHCLLLMMMGLVAHAERHILTCCRFAKFNERNYERTGSMYLGGENGTEVPMYSSVGTEDNGGNMVSVNWNTAEDDEGNLVAWPSVNEAKMEDIGSGSPMMIMEEIGVAQERRPTSGGLKCPDELSFHDVNKVAKEWICDETKIEECTDKLETCPSAAVQNRCQTLAKICCATCKVYFANKTAEIELEREMAATNSFSIGSSMTMKPASPERQATINGGALADDFVLAVESENETETDTETADEEVTVEESAETTETEEGAAESEQAEPEPEPEAESSSALFGTSICLLLLFV